MKLKTSVIAGIAIFLTILIVIIVLSFNYLSYRKNYGLLREQAIKTAQNYMEGRYQQKIDYLECNSIYDKMVWSVTFPSPDDSTKNIRVHMYEVNDSKLPIEERIHISGESLESKTNSNDNLK